RRLLNLSVSELYSLYSIHKIRIPKIEIIYQLMFNERDNHTTNYITSHASSIASSSIASVPNPTTSNSISLSKITTYPAIEYLWYLSRNEVIKLLMENKIDISDIPHNNHPLKKIMLTHMASSNNLSEEDTQFVNNKIFMSLLDRSTLVLAIQCDFNLHPYPNKVKCAKKYITMYPSGHHSPYEKMSGDMIDTICAERDIFLPTNDLESKIIFMDNLDEIDPVWSTYIIDYLYDNIETANSVTVLRKLETLTKSQLFYVAGHLNIVNDDILCSLSKNMIVSYIYILSYRCRCKTKKELESTRRAIQNSYSTDDKIKLAYNGCYNSSYISDINNDLIKNIAGYSLEVECNYINYILDNIKNYSHSDLVKIISRYYKDLYNQDDYRHLDYNEITEILI
ncbi:MAG: hypothetical protein KC414_15045, partial [Romboutsia sp.]|nr:hypothetical protein [Romboutsia sp.]